MTTTAFADRVDGSRLNYLVELAFATPLVPLPGPHSADRRSTPPLWRHDAKYMVRRRILAPGLDARSVA